MVTNKLLPMVLLVCTPDVYYFCQIIITENLNQFTGLRGSCILLQVQGNSNFINIYVANVLYFFVLSYYVSTFCVPCCDVRKNKMFGSSFPAVVSRRAHVLFVLFVFVYTRWYQTHIVLYFCFAFFVLLPISLDYPFLIATTVFSSVYLCCSTII